MASLGVLWILAKKSGFTILYHKKKHEMRWHFSYWLSMTSILMSLWNFFSARVVLNRFEKSPRIKPVSVIFMQWNFLSCYCYPYQSPFTFPVSVPLYPMVTFVYTYFIFFMFSSNLHICDVLPDSTIKFHYHILPFYLFNEHSII